MIFKKLKPIIAIALCAVLIFSLSVFAFAQQGEKTCFYLNQGGVIIDGETVSGYDEKGNLITEVNQAGYRIMQANNHIATDCNIMIKDADVSIELDGINIDCSSVFGKAAIMIDGVSNVDITLRRKNYLAGGDIRASLEVGINSTLTIGGSGELLVENFSGGAAIGGGGSNQSGAITINSGIITADASQSTSGAGIGGGCNSPASFITINGGKITALGGDYAAGIGGGGTSGGGGTIVINGGTVTATGGINAAGIGGGRLGRCELVTINGGSVKALAGTGAANNIGGGLNRPAAEIVDSQGNILTCAKVNITTENGFVICTLNGEKTSIEYTHPNDPRLYLWLKDGDYEAYVVSQNEAAINAQITIENPQSKVSITKEEKLIISASSKLNLNEKLLTGNLADVQNIKDEFSNKNSLLYLYNSQGESVESFEKFATGQRVALEKSNRLLDFADLVVVGDADGDGEINGMDAIIVKAISTGLLTDASRAVQKAADVDYNSQIDNEDFIALINAGLLI